MTNSEGKHPSTSPCWCTGKQEMVKPWLLHCATHTISIHFCINSYEANWTLFQIPPEIRIALDQLNDIKQTLSSPGIRLCYAMLVWRCLKDFSTKGPSEVGKHHSNMPRLIPISTIATQCRPSDFLPLKFLAPPPAAPPFGAFGPGKICCKAWPPWVYICQYASAC